MSPSDRPGSTDHGLGEEVVDSSTAIAETYIVEPEARRVERLQGGSTAYWVVATAVLVLLGEQTVLAFVLYTPVLAHIAIEFQTADVVWALTVVTLAAAVLVPLMAKLGDRYGKRKTVLVGSAVAAVGSFISVVAPTFGWLLVGRGLMAASAAFLPLTVAIMREVFPTRMRAVAIGLATNGFGALVIGGPLLAGWLTDTGGIRAVFVFNMAVCIVVPILVLLLVPESPYRTRTSIDYWGAGLLGVGSFGVLIGLTQLPTNGLSPLAVTCLVVGVVALVLWWWRTGRIPEPLISLALIGKRTVALPLIGFLSYTCVSGSMGVLIALHWATPTSTGYGQGLSALQIGWWAAPAGVLSVMAGAFVGLTVKSVGYRNHMLIAGVFWIIPPILLGLNLAASPVTIILIYGLFGVANMYTAAAMCLLLLAAPGDQRGIVLGMQGTVAGIAGAALQQLIFVILSRSIVGMEQGAPLYSAGGFTTAYVIAGLVGVIGVVASIFIVQGRRVPRRRRETSAAPAVDELEQWDPSAAPVPGKAPTT